MGTVYWVIFWIFTIFNVLEMFLKNCKYSLSEIMAIGIVCILEKVFGEQRLLKLEEKIDKIFKMEAK